MILSFDRMNSFSSEDDQMTNNSMARMAAQIGKIPLDTLHYLLQDPSKFSLLNMSEEDKKQIIEGLFNMTNPNITVGPPIFDYIDTLALKVFFYGLYILIFFLGTAGNALVCYVVLRNSSMHTVTNMFITNLALSDIFLCVFAVPFTPLYLLTYKEWVFGTLLCHLVPYAQGLCLLNNYFTFIIFFS